MIRFYDDGAQITGSVQHYRFAGRTGITTSPTRPEVSTHELVGLLSAQAERERVERLAALMNLYAGRI